MGWREAWERAERSVSERGSFADVPPADRIALARELLAGTGGVVARKKVFTIGRSADGLSWTSGTVLTEEPGHD